MQPLGRQHCKFPGPGKQDCHPGPGFIKWWEDISPAKKKAARRKDTLNIRKETDGDFQDH